ncbi:MAG TPA: hypothetical protein DEE98_08995 [Elusimicrobia bacterium]|nr:MAG: hypothetical protein A2386_01420 [Elusimicrobia bacterium RIFOXYB1_FULL_48_9]OGS15734.1 MAG: hypothetical protein A2251_08605 [Elusimicrobia bacterium RIFOXYA2_FULL_47_53]OGS31035.1 MAG: hypothetical protein A2323_06925 [Elusimicrobia bacterium RIFOXYB2_FULL_46_23]HBU70499.1 hypothetical protein [Elusimicrobiota bacterium]
MKVIIYLLLMLSTQLLSAKGTEMNNVLIVYGSYAGSTAEVAEKMKDYLEKEGCVVEILSAEGKQIDIEKYDMVIIGSAIHGGKPHENIIKFVDANRVSLNSKKIAVFAVCSFVTSSKENNRKLAQTFPDRVASGLTPFSKAVFAGNIKSLGWFMNYMGKIALGVKPGDYRDWNKINEWAESLLKTSSDGM